MVGTRLEGFRVLLGPYEPGLTPSRVISSGPFHVDRLGLLATGVHKCVYLIGDLKISCDVPEHNVTRNICCGNQIQELPVL